VARSEWVQSSNKTFCNAQVKFVMNESMATIVHYLQADNIIFRFFFYFETLPYINVDYSKNCLIWHLGFMNPLYITQTF